MYESNVWLVSNDDEISRCYVKTLRTHVHVHEMPMGNKYYIYGTNKKTLDWNKSISNKLVYTMHFTFTHFT